MSPLSSRLVNIILILILMLLLCGTGAFYLLSRINRYNDNHLTKTFSPIPIPTDFPTPFPTVEAEIEDQEEEIQIASSAAVIASASAATRSAVKIVKKKPSEYRCNSSCDFSYQCPGKLECVQVGIVKRCRDTTCLSDTTCSCSQVNTTTSTITETESEENAEIITSALPQIENSVMSTVSTQPQPMMTGSTEILSALLLTGISLTGIILAWLRLHS